jgi:hypothetical protein
MRDGRGRRGGGPWPAADISRGLGGGSLVLHLTVGALFVVAMIAPSTCVLCPLAGTLTVQWLVGTAHHATEDRARQHVT